MADTCAQLSSEIAALRAEIARIPRVDENAIVSRSVKASEASIIPQIPAIASGIATAIATGLIAPLQPQIQGAVDKAAKAFGIAEKGFDKATDAEIAASLSTRTAATAIKEATEATTAVGGLRGLINGIGAKVDGFGRAIARLEQSVSEAITTAARAVGISSEALSATARLAGKIAEIFNIIGTFAVLFEQIATLRVLGSRIDAIENGLDRLGNDVSGILGKLLGLQNRIGRNEASIGEVRSIAVNAQSIGQAADRLAGSAYSAAGQAQASAVVAQGTATQAQVTADGAIRNASQANQNAKTAYQKAAEAQLTANNATTIANQATTKANEATTTANRATNKAGEAFGKALEALGVALTVLALYQGLKSLRGLQGIPGRQGLPGLRGLTGMQGVPGINGLNGASGITQIIQIPGTPGRNGRDGLSGLTGRPGLNGLPGLAGRPGLNGLPGRNGVDAVPYNDAGLRAFIAGQHGLTRGASSANHQSTRVTILTPIMAALAPILTLLKSIYDAVMTISTAAIMALLNIINAKLGVQVLGGLSQFIKTIAENTYIEKALSVLTFAATMHNALMLSSNIGQTFITIVDQVLGLILPKGVDGTPISFSNVLGKAVHEIIADTIGEANYKELSEDWQKVNRIYQAASNVFNQISNLGAVVTAGLEVVGGNVAKIGNALKKWGAVGESAYNFMNPQPNLKGLFFQKLQLIGEKLQAIALVVAVPVALVAALNDTEQSVADLKREIAQIDPKDKNGSPIVDAKGKVVHYKPGLEVPVPVVAEKESLQAKADSGNFLELVLEDIFDGGD